MDKLTFANRLWRCVKNAFPQGMRTAFWLLKLTIPVSFFVFLLDFWGVLAVIASWIAPLFKLIGLSGQSSVVLITSFFTNIYSVIAVITTLGIGHREGMILAVMCLISHALIVETAIQKKTGSSPVRMVLIRLLASFIAAWALNLLLPDEVAVVSSSIVNGSREFSAALSEWSFAILVTTLKVVLLVNVLLVLQKILNEFDLIKWILKPFIPLLRIMGLPSNAGFLWMVAYTLGLSYGGVIMISESEDGRLSKDDADLLNHHIAISHSQLEDPLLFFAMGYNLVVLVVPRVLLATLFVWMRRLEVELRRSN